jgi:hypothetical protein
MSEPRLPLAERVLASSVGAARAAAIYGDLEELAVTRGRVWFWAAYLQVMLPFFLRRGISGFFIGIAVTRLIYDNVLPWMWQSIVRNQRRLGNGIFGAWVYVPPWGRWHAYLISTEFMVAELCCYAVPFLLLRFGWRDRLARLGCLLLLVTVPGYTGRMWIAEVGGMLVLAIFGCGLLLRRMRRETALLCLSFVATTVAAFAVTALRVRFLHPGFQPLLMKAPWYFIAQLTLPGFSTGWAAFAVGAGIILRFNRRKRCGSAQAA